MGAGASATSSKKLTPSFSRKESYLGPGGKKGYSRAYEHYHGGAPLLGPAEMRQKWGAYQHHGRKRALAGSHAFVLPEWKETQQCLGGGGGHKWSEMAFDFSSYDAYPAFARIPRQRFAAMIERLNLLLGGGTISSATMQTIVNIIDVDYLEPTDRVKLALYFILISPDYVIQK